MRSPVLLITALLVLAGRASAQQSSQSGASSMSQPPVFKYYVWGQVGHPGTHQLGPNPDVLELLSAAGGPTEWADVRHMVLIQAATGKRTRIDLKKMLETGQVIPLSPGDVVMVPNSFWYSMRHGLGVVSTVVSFATLAVTIMVAIGINK
jgi:hypothetical protein